MALGCFFLGMFLGTCFGIFAVSLLQMGAKRNSLPCDVVALHPSYGPILHSSTQELKHTGPPQELRFGAEGATSCEQGA